MPFIDISAIRPHDSAEPIQIRVIRKWIPFGKRQELCYLFVDINGDAIEAIADLNHQSHFESRITLESCYTITDYLSDTARSYMNVVPHTSCIRLGLRTSFREIDDNAIPHYYFNFVNYDRLRPRINNNLLLTDYIGRLVKASPILYKAGKNMMKISLQDQSGNFIEATLWEEIAFSFDREAALQKPQPVIIAMTSLKVSEYKGKIQLGSINATTIVINPDIEDLENVITRFGVIRGRSNTYPTTSTSLISGEEEQNRLTLEELLQKSAKDNHKTKFTCLASIKEIDISRKWFYKSCTQCRKKVLPKEEKFACPDHGEIQSPRFMYAVNATIVDDTSSVSVALFNEVMTSLLGIDCHDMVVIEDFSNPHILPTPLRAIRGKPKIFQLLCREHDNKDKMSFTVNKVFEPKASNNDIASTSAGPTTKYKKR
ncbi:putative replication protein A, OB [Helianthus annuus]|nr:putative replication protein A, OB [Helianthus annuus]